MNDLERALLELDVEWPATPDLATAVMTRIAAEPRGAANAAARREPARLARTRPHAAPWRRLRAARYVAAALVVLVGGTLAVSPEARSTVLRWLGLESVEIKREPLQPRHRARASTSASRSRSRAARRVPTALGTPDAVYDTPLPDGAQRARRSSTPGRRRSLVQTFARPRRRSSRRPSARPTPSSA